MSVKEVRPPSTTKQESQTPVSRPAGPPPPLTEETVATFAGSAGRGVRLKTMASLHDRLLQGQVDQASQAVAIAEARVREAEEVLKKARIVQADAEGELRAWREEVKRELGAGVVG